MRSETPKGERSEAVHVALLGGFRVSVGDRTIEEAVWPLRKAASLVKLLALAPDHLLHREQVMNLLWPGLGDKAAANNLYHALYVGRRVLEPGSTDRFRFLGLRGGQLTLCPEGPLWVDTEAFEETARTARRVQEPSAYRAALEQYAGELLPGDRYEDWAEERRAQLQGLYLTLLAELATVYETGGEFGAAIGVLERLVRVEPAREGAHADLIRLYAASGLRYQALRQYGHLEDALRRELDIEPDPASRRIYDEILSGRVPSSKPPPGVPRRTVQPDVARHNLPVALTSFIGREREISDVKSALIRTRLLTLTGSGGCGKTRLMLEVAGELTGAYPDGVWFAELTSLSETELVPQAVAAALGVREQPDHPITDTLVNSLRTKQLLLILDNCEHLVGGAARLAERLLSSCPGLRIITTSREALGVTGETNWVVPSLSLPDPEDPTPDGASQVESVRLFVDRARYRQPAFDLTGDNSRAVDDICRRLDGIPLAIELAAAKMGVLSVEQIAVRLDDSLNLLMPGSRTAVPKQRTLRATLDWSHALLDKLEQILFRRLSVFAGGWTLEAAEAVGVGGSIEQQELLDLLSRLVDKSLVVAGSFGGEEIRYSMLQPVWQYGRERLEASGEADAIRSRHATWFLPLSERTLEEMDGSHQGAWLKRLEAERGNLRTALEWCWKDERNVEMGLRLAAGLFPFWVVHGPITEGRVWLHRLLSSEVARNVTDLARANALAAAGVLAQRQGDYRTAIALTEESLRLRRRLGDLGGIAVCLNNLCATTTFTGDYEHADSICEESLELSRVVNHRAGVISSLMHLGLAARGRGELAKARAFLFQGVQTCDEFGMESTAFAGWMLAHLSRVEAEEGDYAAARVSAEKGLGIGRRVEDTWAVPLALRAMAEVAWAQGDDERAATLLADSLEGFRAAGFKNDIPECLEALAGVAGTQGHHERKARLLGAADALREQIAVHRPAADPPDHDPTTSTATAGLEQAAWAEGRAMTLEEAIEYALSGEEVAPAPERPPPLKAKGFPYTPREREVALLIARGLTNRQIADELGISERTVENHVAKILRKLGVRSRTQIASRVAEDGLS